MLLRQAGHSIEPEPLQESRRVTGKVGGDLPPCPVDSAPEEPPRDAAQRPRHGDRPMHCPHLLSEVTQGPSLTTSYRLSRHGTGFCYASKDGLSAKKAHAVRLVVTPLARHAGARRVRHERTL